MSDARAVRSVDDSAIGADDIHDDAAQTPISFSFHRALPHFVRFQTLGISSRDVAPQSPRDRRTKLGRDARPRMFQERQYRRRALESVTYTKKQKRKRGGPTIDGVTTSSSILFFTGEYHFR
jgi:hypothetical protein